MILRKINACLSLITTLLFLDHAIFHAVWMISEGSIAKSANSMPWILFILMMLHAIISIILAFLGHKGAEKRKCNGYSNMNRATYMQRMTGILLIFFSVLHIAGAKGTLQPPAIVHAILPPVFFAVAAMHVAVSTCKAFITLGIGNAKLVKIVDIFMKVVCGATLIADVIGFYFYLC